MLSQSKVQFNCALQDWVSFTLLEALTFGCAPLYPMHRSFPETLQFAEDYLYAPFSLESANAKLDYILSHPKAHSPLAASVLEYHDDTLNQITSTLGNLV